MEEERERSLRGERGDTDKETEGLDSGNAPTNPVTVDDLGKDQLSAHESNSTDPAVAFKSGVAENETNPIRPGGEEFPHDGTERNHEDTVPENSLPDRKLVLEDSCNGSSNSIDVPEDKPKSEPVSISADVFDSQGASGDEGATKENSDMQSSAGKSRKETEIDKATVQRSTTADEREHECHSRAFKDSSAECQSLMEFLSTIRAHKLGSVFQGRLLSQENSVYEKTILQHIDLEKIEERLKEGFYSSSSAKFFRDLLLLVSNAIVFFPGDSTEAKAAIELRVMIRREISQRHSKSDSSTVKEASLQSLSMPKKEEAQPSNNLVLKPGIAIPLFVCRKRSSITAKAALLAEERDEKPSIPKPDEPKITKKRTRERFSSVSSNLKNNIKNQGGSDKNSSVESGKQQSKGGSSSDTKDVKIENSKSKPQTALESKKRGAAIFLNRMNHSSSSTSNGLLVDAMKNTPLTSDSILTKGQKKESSTRQTKVKAASPVKRNVGRPPKRAPPPPPPTGKRARERADPDSSSSSKAQKKRSRKL